MVSVHEPAGIKGSQTRKIIFNLFTYMWVRFKNILYVNTHFHTKQLLIGVTHSCSGYVHNYFGTCYK